MNLSKATKYKATFLNLKKLLQNCPTVLLPHWWGALCLTGCMGVYEGGFECPPGVGVGCKSISEVNQMVDQCGRISVSQRSECKIPEFRNQDPAGRMSDHSIQDSAQSGSCTLMPEIWYAPGSVQYSDLSVQRCPSDITSPQNKDKRERDKGYAPDSI